jgi:hypothetical protein
MPCCPQEGLPDPRGEHRMEGAIIWGESCLCLPPTSCSVRSGTFRLQYSTAAALRRKFPPKRTIPFVPGGLRAVATARQGFPVLRSLGESSLGSSTRLEQRHREKVKVRAFCPARSSDRWENGGTARPCVPHGHNGETWPG